MTSATALNKRQILLIDDDYFVRDFAVNAIEFGTNRKVTTFESGFRAWQYIQKNPTDIMIIIADANIPDMSGMEMLAQAKQHYPDKTFIITSSNPDHEKAAYHMGADAFVSKPFDVNDLMTIIGELILTPAPPTDVRSD